MSQIRNGAGQSVIWSWGARQWSFSTDSQDRPFLLFRVSGFLHKGLVQVVYNAGNDLYIVRLIVRKKGSDVIVKEWEGVYGEDLAGLIDSNVEHPGSEEKYALLVSKSLASGLSKI